MDNLENTSSVPLGETIRQDFTYREHAVRGFAWNSAWRWATRLLSLINTATLARLLTPYDFGIYAMAMIVVNFIEVFRETGVQLALIRMGNPSREHLDTAWTMQVLTGLLLGGVIVAVAPAARRYFGVYEIETLLYLISIRVFVGGFVNIGVVSYRIHFEFEKDFYLGVLHRLLSVVLLIALAVTLRSFWALAAGVVASNIVLVCLSYWLHPYRPRFCLQKFKELWSFSVWVLIAYVSAYAGQRLDALIVGGIVNPTEMGFYDAAVESSATPIVDILDPVTRALFPIYTRFQTDPQRMLFGYLNSLSLAAAVAFPASIGLALVAHDFIDTLFGPQWDGAADILQLLAFSGIGLGLVHGIQTVLNAVGRVKLGVALTWIRIVVVLPGLIFAGHFWGMLGVAVAQTCAISIMVPVWFTALHHVVPITWLQILSRLWRPVLASAIMVGAVSMVFAAITEPSAHRLALAALVGTASFSLAMFGLWGLAGKPDGVEEIIFDRVQKFGGIRKLLDGLGIRSSRES